MPLLTEDRALLAAFRRGERPALMTVYRHYGPSLGDHFYRLGVRSAIDVDDLVHDTFMKAFSDSARLSYDGIKPFRNYLLTIARNLLIDQRRRARAIYVEPSDLDLRAFEAPEGSPADLLSERRELEGLMSAYFAELSPEDLELLRLRFQERCSQRETAETLGLTRQRVRTREGQLRDGLRARLEGTGYLDFRASSLGALPGAATTGLLILYSLLRIGGIS